MKIKLSPVQIDERLNASVRGDCLTLNGIEFNFEPLQEGELLPCAAIATNWLLGNIQRLNGEIHLTLRLPHGHMAPHETRFPSAYEIPMDVRNGEVKLPLYDISQEGLV